MTEHDDERQRRREARFLEIERSLEEGRIARDEGDKIRQALHEKIASIVEHEKRLRAIRL